MKALKQDLLVHRLCHEFALAPLTEAEVGEYLAVRSSGASPPHGLSALLHRHSEGNPLFMVAALDHMTKRGLISQENGSWQLHVPLAQIGLAVPDDLCRMIEAQIERLSLARAPLSKPAAALSDCKSLTARRLSLREARRPLQPSSPVSHSTCS